MSNAYLGGPVLRWDNPKLQYFFTNDEKGKKSNGLVEELNIERSFKGIMKCETIVLLWNDLVYDKKEMYSFENTPVNFKADVSSVKPSSER